MEENKKDKIRRKMPNSTKWIIFVTIFLIVLVTTTIINLSSEKKTVEVSSKEETEEKIEENRKEEVKLSELTETKNKTEEELKKLNEKELEESQKKTENKTNTKRWQNKYYLKVNYGAQVVNVYTYDKEGKYTVPVKAFVCSTGAATPKSGVYKIPTKITWCHLFGDVWGHYSTQIVGDILFHSVPYAEKRSDSLEWWLYDRLGSKDSMGCVRLTVRDAKWIFDNVSTGTSVEFYSSSNPGPLGKPSAQKISNAPKKLRVWDPTDPDYRNPWRTYKPPINNNDNTNQNTNHNTIINNITNNNEQTNQSNNEQHPEGNVQTNETIENQEQPGNNENQGNENVNQEGNNKEENNEQQNGEVNNTQENEMVNEEK